MYSCILRVYNLFFRTLIPTLKLDTDSADGAIAIFGTCTFQTIFENVDFQSVKPKSLVSNAFMLSTRLQHMGCSLTIRSALEVVYGFEWRALKWLIKVDNFSTYLVSRTN